MATKKTKKLTKKQIREHLVKELRLIAERGVDELTMAAQATLVMYDAGILKVLQEAPDGKLSMEGVKGVSDERMLAAQNAFEKLVACDDATKEAYYNGKKR